MPKYRQHPLIVLFNNKRMSHTDGMNALQEGPLRLISDNCVNPEDVAICDALEVLRHVEDPWAKMYFQ